MSESEPILVTCPECGYGPMPYGDSAMEPKLERLRAIVDKLPKDSNGDPVLPGMFVAAPDGSWAVVPGVVGNGPVTTNKGTAWRIGDCCLCEPRKAAEAVGEDEETKT